MIRGSSMAEYWPHGRIGSRFRGFGGAVPESILALAFPSRRSSGLAGDGGGARIGPHTRMRTVILIIITPTIPAMPPTTARRKAPIAIGGALEILATTRGSKISGREKALLTPTS